MDKKALKTELIALLETVDAAYLSTIGPNGFPQTRMMSNLRCMKQCRAAKQVFKEHTENFLVYMVTGHSSPKMEQIRANPKISVYYCNAIALQTLLLMGIVEEVDDLELKKTLWQEEWKIHWPGGAEDPELVVLKFLPDYARGWNKDAPFEFSIK